MRAVSKIQGYVNRYMEGPTAKKIGDFSGRAVESVQQGFQKIAKVAAKAFETIKQKASDAKIAFSEHVFKPLKEGASRLVSKLSARVESFREKHCPFKGKSCPLSYSKKA